MKKSQSLSHTMKEPVSYLSGVGAMALLFGLLGCSQDVSLNYSEEETTLENVAIGQNEAYDALEVDYQMEADFLASRPYRLQPSVWVDNCTTVTNDSINKILTIDFGPYTQGDVIPGCLSLFSRIRSGKIIVRYVTTLGDTATNRIITFDSYIVNNKVIEDTVEWLNISLNSAQKLQGTVKFVNLKIGFPDGTSITLNGHQTRVWDQGMGDQDPSNNIYLIPVDSLNPTTGLTSNPLTGMTSTQRSFRSDQIATVLINFSCAIPGNFARTVGLVSLTTLSGFPDQLREVNYCTGTTTTTGSTCICDQIVEVVTYRRTFFLSVY